MPLYEYRCDECGEEFEVIKRITERTDDVECPGCGKPARKLLSGFAVGTSGGGAGTGASGGGCSGGGGG
jgi:putative FmdB family regulatory protein